MCTTHKKYRNDEGAFSLIEILVVVLIIGILAAIAIPVFLSQRKSAYDATLKSDMKSVALAYSTRLAQGKVNNDFTSDAGGADRVIVVADDRYANDVENLAPNGKIYNKENYQNVKGLEDLKVSSGTITELIIKSSTNLTGNSKVTPENQFCITGSNVHSNYYSKSIPDKHTQYAKGLYYSSMSGGIKTIEELYNSGVRIGGNEEDPCFAHVSAWERAMPATSNPTTTTAPAATPTPTRAVTTPLPNPTPTSQLNKPIPLPSSGGNVK